MSLWGAMIEARLIAAAAPLAAAASLVTATPAQAAGPVTLDAVYSADVSSVASGGADRRVRYLDNLDLLADADLGALAGWKGAKAHVHVLNNLGARPNDAAGTLEGIDNIEVSRAALRLFEAWVEAELGKGASLRAGLIDLNAEFNASEVSDQLIAPPFGITSEFAATGPNGPSIFPSTALAMRLNVPFGQERGYLRAGLFNARASTFGDPGGVDVHFRDGVLAIGEAGTRLGPAHLSLGGWAYSLKRESLFATDANGDPLRRTVAGAYLGAEGEVARWGGRSLGAMVRFGFARGGSTSLDHAAQAALKLAPLFPGRDESVFSIGAHYARTSPDFRAVTIAAGLAPAQTETGLELTIADRVLPFFTLQPDVQLIFNPGGIAGVPPALVTTLRLTFAIPRS